MKSRRGSGAVGTGPFPPCVGLVVAAVNSLTGNTGKGAQSAKPVTSNEKSAISGK